MIYTRKPRLKHYIHHEDTQSVYLKKKAISSIVFFFFSYFIEFSLLSNLQMGGGRPTYYFLDLSAFLFLSVLLFLLPMKMQNILGFFSLLIEAILSYSIVCVHASTGRVFSWDMLALLNETKEAMGMAVFPKRMAVYMFSPVIIYVGLWILFKNLGKDANYLKFLKSITSIFASIVLVGCLSINGIVSYKITKNYKKQTIFTSDAFYFATFESAQVALSKFGLWGYYSTDLLRNFFPSLTPNIPISADDCNFEDYTSVLSGLAKDDNVIFILAESFEKYGVSKELTPTLYALKNGIDLSDLGISNFYNVQTLANGQKELTRKDYSFNSSSGNYEYTGVNIYDGLELGECGLILNHYKSLESTNNSEMRVLTGNNLTVDFSLSRILSSAGYTTNYIHGNYDWFYQRGEIIPTRVKFDNSLFYDQMIGKIECSENLGCFVLDSEIINYYNANSNEFDLSPENKFFTFLMSITTHGNYNRDFEMLNDYYKFFDDLVSIGASDDVLDCYKQVQDEELKECVRNYIAGALDTEKALALVIDELYQSNELENTTIVFVGDHNAYSDNMPEFKSIYYEKVNGVPYASYEYPEIEAFVYSTKIRSDFLEENGYSREINQPTSAFDLAPTILTLLGVEFNNEYYLGYPVINKSVGSEKLLYNKVVQSCSYKEYIGINFTTPDGVTFYRTVRDFSEEEKLEILYDINAFRLKKYYFYKYYT